MEKIVIFGGSFNPFHEGHLKIAEDAFDFVDADKLIIVPSLNHPTKDAIQINQVHILNMLKLTLSSSIIADCMEIDSFELENLAKVSYTYDTVKYLKMRYPDSQLYLLIGSDNLSTLHTWYKYEELKMLVKFIVGLRAGYSVEKIDGVKFDAFETTAPDISSSILRDNISKGIDVSEYLDVDVNSYIAEKNLYKR